MSHLKYPHYKPSAVDWLGDVPAHWEIVRLRYLTNIQKGRLPKETLTASTCDTDLPYLSMEYLRGETEASCFVSKNPGLICAEDGDILLLWDGSNAGEILRAKKGVVSSTIALISAKGTHKDFFAYACKSLERRLKDQTIGMGIPHVSGDELRSFPIPIPPHSEQTQIADFLDHETAKIDALVAEQRRLMELLREKRQAVISRAVTRGLNPSAPLKPSGIDWLGDVPTHWEVLPLKHCISQIEQGWSPLCESGPADDNEWGVLKVGCVNNDHFNASEQKTLPSDVAPIESYEIRAGDILMSRGNTLELVGMASYVRNVRPRLLLSDLLYRFRADSKVANGEFVSQFLRSPFARCQIERVATGTSSSMKKIGQGDIGGLVITLPPLAEQAAIVRHLDAQTAKFDALSAEAERAITLLQERRTALISAAVTGRINVTGASCSLVN